MPDWFYRTISRPILFRLPAETSRTIALGFMGRLARVPLGKYIIDFLGHMAPDSRLAVTRLGITFPSPVGLAPMLDANAIAIPALARFGFGFVEIGPVTLNGAVPIRPIERLTDKEALRIAEPASSLALVEVRPRIQEVSRLGLPILVRLGQLPDRNLSDATADGVTVIRALARETALFAVPIIGFSSSADASQEEWRRHVGTLIAAAREGSAKAKLLISIAADFDFANYQTFLSDAIELGASGFLVDGSISDNTTGARLIGRPARQHSLQLVRALRNNFGTDVLILAAGGIHEPKDALDFRKAGADLIQTDTGLIYSGPGLPKRINDALLFESLQGTETTPTSHRPTEMTWFWTGLMGTGMVIGSILALIIALTRVVLPYDEMFVGMTRVELTNVNPRLPDFMTHDRISLAGTMIAIGIMYVGLSLFGIRRGLHWAQKSVFLSAFVGFASFFLFLGFGYLDTFHAFVTAVLLQLLLLGVHSKLGVSTPSVAPEWNDSPTWKRSLWGQLLLIFHGCALLGAGATISLIGVTHVFVHEDLQFMQTTAEALQSANPRLVPLIAHDRATFGGMLLSSGIVFLLPALWGFRTGSAWLWWTMLIAGLAAYTAAIGVHYHVGYIEFMHLLPAFAGLILFLFGMALSRTYLCQDT